jgi:hypothetical protein
MNRNFYSAFFFSTILISLTSCATNASLSPADGTWDFTMSSPFGALTATVMMTAEGGMLTGSFDLGGGRTWSIDEGVAEGNEISFRLDRDGSPMVYDMSATVEGDSIIGSASAMGTEVPWTMTRRS